MKELEDFIKNNSPNRRRSVLEPFREAIFKLYSDGFQIEQIQDFLKENKIKTSTQNIYRFLKSKKNSSLKNHKVVGEADHNLKSEEDVAEMTISDLRKRFKNK